MKQWLTRAILLLGMTALILPAAARTLTVEGVVSPAWVERAGKREPLKAVAAVTRKRLSVWYRQEANHMSVCSRILSALKRQQICTFRFFDGYVFNRDAIRHPHA